MQVKGRARPSAWHEGVYHAASSCQAHPDDVLQLIETAARAVPVAH